MSSGPYSFETGAIKTFHGADYGVFAGIMSLSAVIGLFFAIKDRKKNTTDEYLLAGRRMHPIPVAMSLLSSFISSVTILGTPAEVYVYNTMFWWVTAGFIITVLGAGHIFIPVFYRLGITSIFQAIYVAAVLYTPSLALNAVTGLSLWGSIAAVSVVCIFYTSLGGIRAVLLANALQLFTVYVGMLTILITGTSVVGGFDKAWTTAKEHGRIVLDDTSIDPRTRHSVWTVMIGGGFFWCAIFGTNQTQVQRALSVRTLKRAKMAIWLNLPGMAAVTSLTCLIGVVIFTFYSKCDPVKFGLISKPDQLLPLFMMDLFGDYRGLPGLLLASIFSSSLSTISSGLNAVSAVLLEDFVKPFCCEKISHNKATLLAKIFVVMFGLLTLVVAFAVSQLSTMILQLTYAIFSILAGPLLGMFTLGILFPWANKWGATAGIITSLTLLSWIEIGTFVTQTSTAVKSDISTAGCNWNVSSLATITVSDSVEHLSAVSKGYDKYSGIQQLYSISYLLYTPFGTVTTMVVGMMVSLITGPTDPRTLNPKLICPFFDVFCPYLPERVRKPLRFGVRHREDHENDVKEEEMDIHNVNKEMDIHIVNKEIDVEVVNKEINVHVVNKEMDVRILKKDILTIQSTKL